MNYTPTQLKDQTNENNNCCEWKGTKNSKGYGVITINGKQFRVQRLAVLLSGRKIPKGMVTDHTCRNRACINPNHLRVITNVENVMIGESFSPKNAKKETCIKGHPFNKVNTYIYKTKTGRTWRFCRICKIESKRKSYAKSKNTK